MQKRWSQGILASLCLLLIGGCADIQPLWKGTRQIESLTLYFSEPLEFDIQIPEINQDTKAMIELAITYDQGISRSDLPLFLTLEAPDHHVQEFNTTVLLKDQGQWLGVPQENEVDYTITHIAATGIEFLPGSTYELKIYANDEEKEKIYGIIYVTVRLYREEDLEAAD